MKVSVWSGPVPLLMAPLALAACTVQWNGKTVPGDDTVQGDKP